VVYTEGMGIVDLDGARVIPSLRVGCEGEAYCAACPDCPGGRRGVLEVLVGRTKSTCRFETAVVDERAFAPASWNERYGFGLVRRGVLVRQRVDAEGFATAIDAAGPGCLFWIDRGGAELGYAATDLIVCLCPRASLDDALERHTEIGRDLLRLQREANLRVERLTEARGAPTVRARVARLLRVLSETLSPPRTRTRLPSGLQQRDMSKLLGVRHETFCRALKKLETAGAIQRSPDGIAILDPSLLG